MLLSLAVAGIAGAILEMLGDRRTGDKHQTLDFSIRILGKYCSGPLSKVLSVLLELNFSCSKNSGLESWLFWMLFRLTLLLNSLYKQITYLDECCKQAEIIFFGQKVFT